MNVSNSDVSIETSTVSIPVAVKENIVVKPAFRRVHIP